MSKSNLINSSLEVSLRIILILNKYKDVQLSIDEIVMVDYYIIHLNDFYADFESIHPPLPNRENELLIRRKLVVNGINILESRSLVKVNYNKNGIRYSTNYLALSLSDYMESKYFKRMVENINIISDEKIDSITKKVSNLVGENSKLWINELL